MVRIFLEPNEVWDFCLGNKEEIEGGYIIGQDYAMGITAEVFNDWSGFSVAAYQDNAEILYYANLTEENCEQEITEMYDSIFYGNEYHENLESEACIRENDEWVLIENEAYERETIEDRESELEYAISEFLDVVLYEATFEKDVDREELERDCVEQFLLYLVKRHGADIYRPTYLKKDTKIKFIEYPYKEIG